MPEQILPGLYRLEIPIPHSPLKATNAYVVKGKDRNLLIDTGQNHKASLAAMRSSLAGISVDLSKTDIVLTHMHADHVGLLPFVRTDTSTVYATACDAEFINNFLTVGYSRDFFYQVACRSGFSPEEARQLTSRDQGITAAVKAPLDFSFVSEGTILAVGDYRFTCIETPGHTGGHICLYEPDRKLLLSGDHIIGDISPNITFYREGGDPLGDFIASLEKTATLAVDLVLPGHRRVFTDCRSRISELLEHHRQRAREVLAILADGPATGYQVAARMTWDMVFRVWSDVPVRQKFFATGEALSHLRYLECQGLVCRCAADDQTVYWHQQNSKPCLLSEPTGS
ncbi:MAG: MBL fold metallo-hydrolase [Negativicutes bacterium]|nr:MBL fold metallo-hydrolase [Negativicutes bacterium]